MDRLAIEEMTLGQFRSWSALSLAPGIRSVALYGANGAGKTNLLEALSLLVPGRGLRRAEAEALLRRPGASGWRLRATLLSPEGEMDVMTGADEPSQPRRRVEIDGKQAPQTALGRHIRMIWLTPAMDRLWAGPASDRRQYLDRIALGFAPDHAQAALDYEKAMRGRNRLLAEGMADPAWLDGLEAEMARRGARIARQRAAALARLRDAADAAKTLFPQPELSIVGAMEEQFEQAIRGDQDLDVLEAAEAAGLAAELSAGRGRDAAAGRTLSGPHRSDLEAVYAAKEMPARLCSTGEQKALLISVALANAGALKAATGAAPILLLDEVAAHLDAGRRRALYGEIAALGAQAWMTGTGAELFDGLEGALVLEVAEEAGASRIMERPSA